MRPEEIQSLLDNTSQSLIEVYFELQTRFEETYGTNTVVLIEVGSFFEIYGVDNDHQKIGKTKEIAELLNLQITRKNKSYPENSVKNPLMAGFPTVSFERFMARLAQENKYTIVLVRQKGVPPKVTRYVDQIVSPGVNFDYTLDHEDSFIASLFVDRNNGIYSAGYTAIDVTTGKTYAFEVHGTKEDKTVALDEIFRLLQTHRTAELILTAVSPNIDLQEVSQYLEIQDHGTVHINTDRHTISYQNELFKQVYITKSFLSHIEYLDLERKPLTSESLAVLIEFIIEHDQKVLQKLKKPTILENKNFLYLGNNPLEQLSITSKDPDELTVLKLMDKTVTSMGRRLLRERLLHPIIHKIELENRYALAEAMTEIADHIQLELRKIYDLERIVRRIRLGRLHPLEINFLYDSLVATRDILELIEEKADATQLQTYVDGVSQLVDCIRTMEQRFDFNESSKVLFGDISTSLFQRGVHTELDELVDQKNAFEQKMETIRAKILELLQERTGKEEHEYVLVKQLEKEGHYISMTKNRYVLIEDALENAFVSVDGTVYAFSDFGIKVLKTNVKLTAPVIDQISEEIVSVHAKIVALAKELFLKELLLLEEHYTDLWEQTIECISKIDVAVSTIRTATSMSLVRPEILDTKDNTQLLEIESLRHPLVEAGEEQGVYIPNTVVLGNAAHALQKSVLQEIGDDVKGVLLYGINSSGKSSLMKSIGVALVLAQSGFFVPASSMRFTLFHELFTRIIAKDNLRKGLSSFAVEMLELKNIFNRCSDKSLILGDEISHGTETLSAISIVSATIARLTEKQSMFLFTTHLHQLHKLDLLKEYSNVASVHMAVSYDEDKDVLVFDRFLKQGSGSSIYGLEFAQSLHMDDGFIKKALAIRKELANELNNAELLTKKQQSRYNKKLFFTSCALCDDPVEDTHHIQPQQNADAHGKIGHMDKDHKANLVPLCKECHNKVHAGELVIKGFVMTSEGLQLDIES